MEILQAVRSGGMARPSATPASDVQVHYKSTVGGRMSNEKMEEIIKKLIPPKRNKAYAYKMGKDCAKNGSNTENCHFSIFSSRENADEWQRGLRKTNEVKEESK